VGLGRQLEAAPDPTHRPRDDIDEKPRHGDWDKARELPRSSDLVLRQRHKEAQRVASAAGDLQGSDSNLAHEEKSPAEGEA
jgi:hypothetical protein